MTKANPQNLDRHLAGAARALTLLLPVALFASRAGAEIIVAVIALLFCVHAAIEGDFTWCKRPFMRAGFAWWLWQVLATTINHADLGQALALIRIPVLVVALAHWVLRDANMRARLALVISLSAAWVGLECWQQMLFGHNLFGQPRYMDGALTGPFDRPRAGPVLALILFPALLPAVYRLLERPSLVRRALGAALLVLAAATVVMIGQRMPALLVLFGFVLTGLLLPRLRLWVAGAVAAGLAVLALTPILSPSTYHKLVQRFTEQASHFGVSSYGQLYHHAFDLVRANPVFGIGYNAFRESCGVVAAHAPVFTAAHDVVQACNTHPHNYYFEAAVNAGVPGLLLFCVMVVCGLRAVLPGRVLGASTPLRVGVCVAAILALWPIASTSSFLSFPNVGWIALMLGLGMALAEVDTQARR